MTNVNGSLVAHYPLTERGGDTYYIGDLSAGIALVLMDREAIIKRGSDGTGYVVSLIDRPGDADSVAEWGGGETLEQAWRFAIGASCGPLDAEYDQPMLLAALITAGERA